uniref:RNA-dependent RNA polymerase n=1 Tax=Uromyces fabae virus TaxID=3069272 RepID=A0AA51UAV9_9VIRU|nr:RNA-dependent RNA polymerase [Uromyces fabae virus]
MSNPSVCVARFQTLTPFMRKDEERHDGSELLRPFVPKLIDDIVSELAEPLVSARVKPDVFKAHLNTMASEGQYTVHNRKDLSERFLNYAVERQTQVENTDARMSIEYASQVVRTIVLDSMLYSEEGIVKSRQVSNFSSVHLEEICNQGNANDYKLLYGINKRKDPEMLEIGSQMFSKIYNRVSRKRDGFVVDPEDVRSEPMISPFGKTEVVGSTIGPDGVTREVKKCRAIFPTSPTDYFKKCFLFHDLCESLQKNCPVYGPGFAAARGCDSKVTSILSRVTRGTTKCTDPSIKIINRDMKHWDANMKEHMILTGMKLMEELVDKTELDDMDKECRQVIFDLACDEVLTKLVEHPSGFMVWVSGTLPSGTYVTSTLNSICNAILCVACPIFTAVSIDKCRTFADIDRSICEISSIASRSIICNGDNQMGTNELYKFLGVDFDPLKDNIFFSEVGMKVKVDECGSSSRLSDCMFSSRKFLRVKNDLYPTRPLESMLRKLYAKPFADLLEAKLYIRSMMIDMVAIDPIVYKCLSNLDARIEASEDDLKAQLSKSSSGFIEYMRSSIGVEIGDDDWQDLCQILSSSCPKRNHIMTLLMSKSDIPGADREFVSRGFITGDVHGMDSAIDRMLSKCSLRTTLKQVASVNCEQWRSMLIKTGQIGIYLEMGDLWKLQEAKI